MSKDKQNNTNRMVALVMGIIGLTLTIIPVPQAFVNFKPNWVLLLLIFLSINLPKQFNLGYSFGFGLIIDVIKGALLGQHALAMTVIVFMTTKYHLQLRMKEIIFYSSSKFILSKLPELIISRLVFSKLNDFTCFIKSLEFDMIFN